MELDELRGLRSESFRIVELGLKHLKSGRTRDPWSTREQVFLSALDTHQVDVCTKMLTELKKKFPKSQRVSRLEAIFKDFQGDKVNASKMFDQIAKESNTQHTEAMKRNLSMLKESGDTIECIKQLTEYLGVFQTDAEGWQELAQLYLELGRLREAAFCLEEVILCYPHSYLSFLAYAECLYSIGAASPVDKAALLTARKYFCHTLTIKESTRALWGLAITTKLLDNESDLNKKINGIAVNVLSKTKDKVVASAAEQMRIVTKE